MGTDGVWVMSSVKCAECGRIFDLMDGDDAAEWHGGHDCEVGV